MNALIGTMEEKIGKAAKMGIRIVQDLLNHGCSKWRIAKEIRAEENNPNFSYHSVTEWALGRYCDDKHIPALQRIRYRFYVEKNIPLFKD